MIFKVAIGLAMAVGAVAESSSVTSMYMMGYDVKTASYIGSLVGSDGTATTYSVHCPAVTDLPPGTYVEDCGLGPGITLIANPPYTTYTMGYDTFSMQITCSIGGTTKAVCTSTISGGNLGRTVSTETVTETDVPKVAVTITGQTSVSPTASHASSSEGSDATSTGTPIGTSTTPTGGMPQITGNSDLLFAGAAVALAAIL